MSLDLTSLRAVSQALASGQTSSVQLTEQMLERALDPAGEGGRAYTRVFAQQARAAASASDQLRKAGLARSELEGVVIAVKDLFDVAGVTTRAGSVVLDGAPEATADAVIVRRLREAGAVILGTTNMTEFAFSGLGINPHYGTPLNPWDRQTGRIPGGSSSGSAVVVSDEMACAAIGTDTGGSVRIPAALCGLTGFKPTARRVSQTGTLPLSQSLDSIGPIARTVACCAMLDAVLAGEQISVPAPAGLSTLVLGLPRRMFMDGLDDSVADAFDRACERLRQTGVRIVEFDIPELDELAQINHAGGLSAAQSWAWHRDLLESRQSEYDPRVAARILRGRQQSASDYIAIQKARADWILRVSARVARFDAIITPTVPVVAPPVKALQDDDALYICTNMLMLRNPSVINFLDGCSLSLPCHQPGQAPVGLMLSCSGGHDRHLLSVGLACEAALQES